MRRQVTDLSGIVQQVRLNHNGKFSNADFQGVHSENGPVLSEELGKKYVLLFNQITSFVHVINYLYVV